MYQIICKKLNNPFHAMKFHDWHGAPTYNQMRLMNAIENGLISGIFYSSDMYDFVKNELKDILSDDVFLDMLNGTNKNENGAFGMDIYYARITVESVLRLNANKKTLNTLISLGLVNIGSSFKNLRYGTHKFSTSIVSSINNELGIIDFLAKKRGTKNQFTFKIGANDTKFLSSITEKVKDNTVLVGSDGHTYVVDPFANITSEFLPQLTIGD